MPADLRILVLDDEPLAASRLIRMLRRIGGIGEIMTASNGLKGLESFAHGRPDIILLDIEMPLLDGFQFLDALPPGAAPFTICVTAFDRYAVEAYRKRALHYLMKPVAFEQLADAIEDARKLLSARDSEQQILALNARVADLLQQLSKETRYLRFLWVSQRGGRRRIAASEIDRIEAERDYVRVYADGLSFLLHQGLGAIERQLDPGEFQRVHRSALVRMSAIESVRYEKYGALSIRTRAGGQVRVSRKYAPALRRLLAGA
ncbi:MAG: LytR/AlgR family response regulator transcription factor [Sphingomonas sp.]